MLPAGTQKLKLRKVCSLGLKFNSKACYFSILDCPDGKIRLYYRAKKNHKEGTRVVSSDDGITFSKPKVIWPRQGAMASNICHNFSPFIHEDNYYAVGGIVRLNKNDSAEAEHCEGLYVLHSRDGMNWALLKDSPVITREHPGFIKAPNELTSDFDSFLSCVYYKGRFHLYFRLNVDVGIRSIQYATSYNLTDWSEVRPVSFLPKFQSVGGQNLYGAYLFSFEEQIKCFLPCYVNNGEGFIGVFEPKTMESWALKNWFCKSRLSPPLISKNRSFPVKGLIRSRENPKVVYYYVHENYLRREADKPVSVGLYVEEQFADSSTIRRSLFNHPAVIRLRVRGMLVGIVANIKYKLKLLRIKF